MAHNVELRALVLLPYHSMKNKIENKKSRCKVSALYCEVLALVYFWINTRTYTHVHTHTHTQPFNDPFSGTTRASRYQKKHSPTHTHPVPDHQNILYKLPPSTTIYSVFLDKIWILIFLVIFLDKTV